MFTFRCFRNMPFVSQDARRGGFLSRLVSLGAGIFLLLLLVPYKMEAQTPGCPTNIVPLSVPWVAEPPIRSNAYGGCWMDIWYCKRLVSIGDSMPDNLGIMHWDTTTFEEGYIDSMILEDSTCVTGISNGSLISAAGALVFRTILDTCTIAVRGRMYKSPCWYMNNDSTGYFFAPCGDGSSYCITECTICTHPVTGCVSWVQGTPPCSDTPPATWAKSHCYDVGCDPPPH